MTETSKAPTDAEMMTRYERAEHARALQLQAARAPRMSAAIRENIRSVAAAMRGDSRVQPRIVMAPRQIKVMIANGWATPATDALGKVVRDAAMITPAGFFAAR